MGPAVFFFFFSFALAWWSRELLTDWPAFLLEEGRLENGALRLAAGEWPYRDFFFSDTPGSLLLHALAHKLSISALGLHLAAASLCAAVVFHWSSSWTAFERALLGLLLISWSFSLWNIAHPIWLALSVALLGVSAGRAGRWVLASFLLVVSFWLHQQVGLLVFVGEALWLFFRREHWRLVAGFAGGLILSLAACLYAQPDLVGRAFTQIAFFPELPLRQLPKQVLGAPLVVLGLWILSLYFFRSSGRLRVFSFFAVLIYAGVGWSREGRGFLLGCLFLFSILIWILAPVLAAKESAAEKEKFFGTWLPVAGLGLLFSGEFPPFLMLFPLTAFFLVWALRRLNSAYQWLPRWWVFAPAFAIILSGLTHQSRLLFLHTYASRDATGRLSFGDVHRASEEMAAVKDFLRSVGLKEGDPLLVLRDAPYFYFFSGFRNPTPFDEVNESSFTSAQYETLFSTYLSSRGKFVVVSGIGSPFLSGELQKSFIPSLRLSHFSVWRRNEN